MKKTRSPNDELVRALNDTAKEATFPLERGTALALCGRGGHSRLPLLSDPHTLKAARTHAHALLRPKVADGSHPRYATIELYLDKALTPAKQSVVYTRALLDLGKKMLRNRQALMRVTFAILVGHSAFDGAAILAGLVAVVWLRDGEPINDIEADVEQLGIANKHLPPPKVALMDDADASELGEWLFADPPHGLQFKADANGAPAFHVKKKPLSAASRVRFAELQSQIPFAQTVAGTNGAKAICSSLVKKVEAANSARVEADTVIEPDFDTWAFWAKWHQTVDKSGYIPIRMDIPVKVRLVPSARGLQVSKGLGRRRMSVKPLRSGRRPPPGSMRKRKR